jgi:hypothetical protein
MTKPAWTPGPWRVNKYGSIGAGKYGTEPVVAHIEPFYGEDHRFGDHTANAALIAAAPDLYQALAFYASEENWRTRGHPQIDADDTPIRHDRGHVARAALAKAEGSASNQQQTEGAHGHQQPE